MDSKSISRLAWLSEVQTRPPHLLVEGPGFVSRTPDPRTGAYASLAALLQGERPGWAIRSTAMLALRSGRALRYVLIRGSGEDATDGEKWQFPSAYCLQKELPLIAASRALHSDLALSGAADNWGRAEVDVGPHDFAYLMSGAFLEGTGRFFIDRNTLEFFYPVTLSVPLWASAQLADARGLSRHIELFHRETILEMANRGEVSSATARICAISSSQSADPAKPKFPPELASNLMPLYAGVAVRSGS